LLREYYADEICWISSLAWAELYITVGRLVRQFDLSISAGTTDAYDYQDYFSSFKPIDAEDLRVKVGRD